MAEVTAKTEFISEVKSECLALVMPSRKEKGCIFYDLHQSTESPNTFIFFESWETTEDLERHLESPPALVFDEKTAGMLIEPERIIYLEKIS